MKLLTITVLMQDDDEYLDLADPSGLTETAFLELSSSVGYWGDAFTTVVTEES